MPNDSPFVELLSAGPFFGLDTTTPADDLNPANFPDGENFWPNQQYGALQTMLGRLKVSFTAPQLTVPGFVTGLTIFHRQGLPDAFIFATTVANIGQLWAGIDGGALTQLTLPVGATLSANKPTFFAHADQWCFLSNGTDTPLKIDQSLNVTFWGIAAPGAAPTATPGVAQQTLNGSNAGTVMIGAVGSAQTVNGTAGTASTTITCRSTLHKPTNSPDTWFYTYYCVATTPVTAQWQINAEAPTAAGSQITFKATAISSSTGTGAILSLIGPNGSAPTGWSNVTDIVQGTTYTYSNAAATAGQYTWVITADTSSETGSNLDTPTSGTYSVTVTPTMTYYANSGAGSITNGKTTTLQFNATAAPTSAATQIQLAVTAVVTPSDVNGTTSYTAILTDSTGFVWDTQSGITGTTTVTFFNASAPAGTYTWSVFATATLGGGGGSSTYNCSCTLSATYYQITSGNLVGGYYYCCTFSKGTTQESSQGVVTPLVTVSAAQATTQGYSTPYVEIDAPADAGTGDVLQATLTTPSGGRTVQTNPASASTPPGTLATQLLNLIAAQWSDVVTVSTQNLSTSGTQMQFIFTAVQPGAAGNQISITFSTFNQTGAASAVTVSGGAFNLQGGVDGRPIVLSAIPQPSDPQADTINLYRIGGQLGQWLQVAALPKGTTTYTDNTADASVTGISLTPARDVPRDFLYIFAHQERIFGFGTTADPSTVWWSNYGEPWGFNLAQNYKNAGANSLGDVAVAGASCGSMGVLFKTRTMYRIIGSTDVDFEVLFVAPVGCVSAQSVAVDDAGTVYWNAAQSVYAYAGAAPTNISDAIYQRSNFKTAYDALLPADKAAACGFVYDHAYYISFPTKSKTYFFSPATQSWWRSSMFTPYACGDLESPTHAPLVLGIDTNGNVHKWFQTPNDAGNPLTAYMYTGIQDAGDIRTTKQYERARLRAPIQASGTQATVTIFANPDAPTQEFWAETVALDGSGQGQYAVVQWALPRTLKGYNAQAKISVTASEAQVTVGRLKVYGLIDRALVENG